MAKINVILFTGPLSIITSLVLNPHEHVPSFLQRATRSSTGIPVGRMPLNDTRTYS